MSYTDFPLVARGDLWTAAQHNTYFKNNFAASEAPTVTTKGDMVIGTGSKAIGRLAITANRMMKSSSTAPAWFALGNPHEILRTNAAASDYAWFALPPACFVSRTASLTLSSATETAITFTAEEYDGYAMWAAGTPTRITIPSLSYSFVYLIQASTIIQATVGLYPIQINFRVTRGGTPLGIRDGMTIYGAYSAIDRRISFSAIATLNPGDIVELIGYNGDLAVQYLENTYFRVMALI